MSFILMLAQEYVFVLENFYLLHKLKKIKTTLPYPSYLFIRHIYRYTVYSFVSNCVGAKPNGMCGPFDRMLIKIKLLLTKPAAAQTLPDATPPEGKIHPFNKITVSFEPIWQF